jgi:hypothetical protein
MRLVFDQGTILLVDAEPSAALADLPGALWDKGDGNISRSHTPFSRR